MTGAEKVLFYETNLPSGGAGVRNFTKPVEALRRARSGDGERLACDEETEV